MGYESLLSLTFSKAAVGGILNTRGYQSGASPLLVPDESLLQRDPANPILTSKDWPYPINSVFNPGATLLEDGTTLLLCRVEDRSGISHLSVARSANGADGWRIDPVPALFPNALEYPEELWGVEDPRITYVPELQQYAVVYTSYSRGGPGVSLALTRDFHSFERFGVVMAPEDKDAALLPYRIKGYWALIHRPMTPLGAHMWISYSPDLRHWGQHRIMLEARLGAWWDANKIGLCSPPIETSEGWLVIYHGVRHTASGSLYRLGLALFDRAIPENCLARGSSWIFGPEAEYERHGDVRDVVFPCGYTIAADGDALKIYYGAADSSIALARASVRSLLAWLKANSSSDGRQG
jgi:beta-1,2-mannobiose phosphorylase / 1,2-beta-oligomannan phosphorylase